MRLSLCMIVRDEEKSLPTVLDSVADHVDEIVIVDTGSKDKTKEVAKKYGAKIYDFEWVDDFSAARNFSFSKATGDWIFWVDADDEVENAQKLRKLCEMAQKHIHAIHLKYMYEWEQVGKKRVIKTTQVRERLIRNNGVYEWKGRLHETLIPKRQVGRVQNNEVIIWHLADEDRRDRSLVRNIEILEKTAIEEKDDPDPRTYFYLASCYIDTLEYERAIGLLQLYLKLSGWAEERSMAWCHIGSMRWVQDKPQEAKVAYLMAIGEYPKNPEPYVSLGQMLYEKEKYDEALHWLEMALAKPEPTGLAFQNPLSYTYRPHLLVAECYLMTSKAKQGLKHLLKAQKIWPDEQVKGRIKLFRTVIANDKLVKEVFDKVRDLKDEGKIQDLLRSLPVSISDNPNIMKLKRKYLPARKLPKKSVVIFTGDAVIGEWGPWSLGEGVGGSEEAVIRLSKRLVEQGYQVEVYANPGARAGVYDQVVYKNYWEIDLRDEFDVFIAWRSPWFFDADIKARKKYLWLHDVMEPEEFTKERLDNLDKVIVLSQYHRSLFPDIPDDKIFLSANGIDADEFDKFEEERDPHKIIYASSHVRGLAHLYEIWPEVKKEVPDARLDIFYGWGSYAAVNKDNPERMEWMEMMKSRAEELEGVVDHGKVSQERIVQETLRSGIWAYPCPFPEISCITAMKSQAGGAIPVSSNFAALAETVRFGTKMDMPEWNDETKEKYKNELVSWLKNPKKQEKERKKMVPAAREAFSWANVSKQWIKEFER